MVVFEEGANRDGLNLCSLTRIIYLPTSMTLISVPSIQSIMEADFFSSSAMSAFDPLIHIQSLYFDLSILHDKIHQAQFLIGSFTSPDANPLIAPPANVVIQDMISVASSILSTLQQLAYCSPAAPVPQTHHSYHCSRAATCASQPGQGVVEMDAGALLAKYTHYCHVCGKGFRRDANLRMHMRAHGDAYKTREALTKGGGGGGISRQGEQSVSGGSKNKYSCPQEGCRWNWKHEKFQPLKSVACAKNHYKRTHCPKLYVCSRCGNKEFSVLSDLRTHEKHCGNPRWRCSCGTTFSRKDKLLGHVALFVGHVQVPEGEGFDLGQRQDLQWIAGSWEGGDDHSVN